MLLARRLERSTAWLLAHDDESLDARIETLFDDGIAALERGVPLAYVLGEAWFYRRRFFVTSDVLVPRPETEELAERAIACVAAQGATRALDVGTGSGVLALTLAAECPQLVVDAIDVSRAALAVATRNAHALGLESRVRFALDASFGADLVAASHERYPLIVANLPYVRRGDLPLAPDPVSYEPRLALDGGIDGLDAYRGLLAAAPHVLAARGTLLLEAGLGTVDALADLARATFDGATVATMLDTAGLPRFVRIDVE